MCRKNDIKATTQATLMDDVAIAHCCIEMRGGYIILRELPQNFYNAEMVDDCLFELGE